jgi:hypothetical protein
MMDFWIPRERENLRFSSHCEEIVQASFPRNSEEMKTSAKQRMRPLVTASDRAISLRRLIV